VQVIKVMLVFHQIKKKCAMLCLILVLDRLNYNIKPGHIVKKLTVTTSAMLVILYL